MPVKSLKNLLFQGLGGTNRQRDINFQKRYFIITQRHFNFIVYI